MMTKIPDILLKNYPTSTLIEASKYRLTEQDIRNLTRRETLEEFGFDPDGLPPIKEKRWSRLSISLAALMGYMREECDFAASNITGAFISHTLAAQQKYLVRHPSHFWFGDAVEVCAHRNEYDCFYPNQKGDWYWVFPVDAYGALQSERVRPAHLKRFTEKYPQRTDQEALNVNWHDHRLGGDDFAYFNLTMIMEEVAEVLDED